MQRRSDGEWRDHVWWAGGPQQTSSPLMASEVAVTFAACARASDTFRSPFIALDPTHWLFVSRQAYEGIFMTDLSLLRD